MEISVIVDGIADIWFGWLNNCPILCFRGNIFDKAKNRGIKGELHDPILHFCLVLLADVARVCYDILPNLDLAENKATKPSSRIPTKPMLWLGNNWSGSNEMHSHNNYDKIRKLFL